MMNVAMASSNLTTATFKVSGVCGMCEKTIETAAYIKGVKKADWNQKTHIITVTYDATKTNVDNIQKSIAKSGYDTEKYKASDEAYNGLHACCKYPR
ncbi:MAG: cation transporter [Chitinophagales bacterium]|nr:cation transporter [Chitinophagales bacterium]